MTATLQFAFLLAVVGVAGITLALIHWRATHRYPRPFPPWATFAFIGGWLALLGALCFAVAFFPGG